ncbi:hypothetical protein ET33_13605 [Paenibacillus tyrfis]|uniref:Uncharacterized protein n=1 Tax=Paenibacillus tyrfis TaxID=1501230 RepID=A0A081PAJ1_9BACL|nr:hypothetical protein ET33_13605 [Paenibacillus tyrfis]
MQCVDMVWYATDDPEICSHPANCLLVRVGKHVPSSSIEQFDRIRFRQPFYIDVTAAKFFENEVQGWQA